MNVEDLQIEYELFQKYLNDSYDSLADIQKKIKNILNQREGFGSELNKETIRLENNFLYISEILVQIYKIIEQSDNVSFINKKIIHNKNNKKFSLQNIISFPDNYDDIVVDMNNSGDLLRIILGEKYK